MYGFGNIRARLQNQIKEIYDKVGKFNFKYDPPKNKWDKILVPGENTYKEEQTWKAKVRCIRRCGYDDIKLLRHIVWNEEYISGNKGEKEDEQECKQKV